MQKTKYLIFPPLSIMASGGPMVNGETSCSPGQSSTLEDTLLQLNNLIQENRELKGEGEDISHSVSGQISVDFVLQTDN